MQAECKQRERGIPRENFRHFLRQKEPALQYYVQRGTDDSPVLCSRQNVHNQNAERMGEKLPEKTIQREKFERYLDQATVL